MKAVLCPTRAFATGVPSVTWQFPAVLPHGHTALPPSLPKRPPSQPPTVVPLSAHPLRLVRVAVSRRHRPPSRVRGLFGPLHATCTQVCLPTGVDLYCATLSPSTDPNPSIFHKCLPGLRKANFKTLKDKHVLATRESESECDSKMDGSISKLKSEGVVVKEPVWEGRGRAGQHRGEACPWELLGEPC